MYNICIDTNLPTSKHAPTLSFSDNCASHPSCWSDPLLPDLGKQDSHHLECHLVSRLPQVLLLHCVPLHTRWLHHCHPTCQQWHLPHSDLPPTRHHLQDWGGGCEEGRRSRRTEGKSRWELYYWRRWWVNKCSYSQFIHTYGEWSCQRVTHCVTMLLAHVVTDTSDVVPSGTIPATISTSALPPAPTAPSETAGELTLVWKTCLHVCVCFGLS